MSLWLCLHFNNLPLEALLKKHGPSYGASTVVVTHQKVLACDDFASLAGVSPGQNFNTAQALLEGSEARILERAPEEEIALLQQLEAWAYGFSPNLQSWQNAALMIEVGSCLKLHRGLDMMLENIETDIHLRGLTTRMGVAETRWAAWLLSHTDCPFACQPEQNLTERLAPLPLNLLTSEFPHVVERLEKAGIHQLGPLLEIPLSAVGKRCGAAFVSWLNQLLGTHHEPIIEYQPPTCFEDTLWFGFEIQNRQELYPAMKRLLTHFCQFLENTQLSSGIIEWHCRKLQGSNKSFNVFSETAREQPEIWFELSCLQMENFSMPEGIEGLSLFVDSLEEAVPPPQDLFHANLHRLSRYGIVDRLRSRLGLQAVGYLDYRHEHLPEDAVIETHSIDPQRVKHNAKPLGQRPLWLFPEPHPIHQEGQQLFWNGVLKIIYGPERIEDQWWNTPVSRDYYIAHTSKKQPIWLYQDRHNNRWYVHGLFA